MSTDDPALLDRLRRRWGFAYDIAFDRFGRARHVTSGQIMDAETSTELDDLIAADYSGQRARDLRS